MSLCWARRYVVHVNANDVVSWPAARKVRSSSTSPWSEKLLLLMRSDRMSDLSHQRVIAVLQCLDVPSHGGHPVDIERQPRRPVSDFDDVEDLSQRLGAGHHQPGLVEDALAQLLRAWNRGLVLMRWRTCPTTGDAPRSDAALDSGRRGIFATHFRGRQKPE